MTSPRRSVRVHAWQRRLVACLAAAAVVASPALVAAPSQAAPARVKVSVKVSKATAATGATVKFSGKVTGRSGKAKVVLQRRSGGKWVKVAATRVKSTKKYALKTTVRSGATRYRVKVKGTSKIRAAASRSLVVRGKAKTSAATPTSPTSTPGVSAEVKRILDDTNAFRAKNGKAPLKLDTAMSKVAQDWSLHLGRSKTFQHNPDYTQQIPKGWTGAAENIAARQTHTTVVTAWINSEGHRRNLLGDYTHIGIGYAAVPGSPYTRYFTQVFGKYASR